MQGLSQGMSPNLFIVGPGQHLGFSHNAIRWNLAIFVYIQAENRPCNRWLDGSLAKSLPSWWHMDPVLLHAIHQAAVERQPSKAICAVLVGSSMSLSGR